MDLYRSEPGVALCEGANYTWTGDEPVSVSDEHGELLLSTNPETYSDKPAKKAAAKKGDDGDKGGGKES